MLKINKSFSGKNTINTESLSLLLSGALARQLERDKLLTLALKCHLTQHILQSFECSVDPLITEFNSTDLQKPQGLQSLKVERRITYKYKNSYDLDYKRLSEVISSGLDSGLKEWSQNFRLEERLQEGLQEKSLKPFKKLSRILVFPLLVSKLIRVARNSFKRELKHPNLTPNNSL
jgi:hypothetical protein